MTVESQSVSILKRLLSGGSITSRQASHWFNCDRLAARIFFISKVKRFPVRSEMIKTNSGKMIAKYSMV